ncbi:MAG: ArnT family glycosyltransferase [Nitrospinota bacterium]
MSSGGPDGPESKAWKAWAEVLKVSRSLIRSFQRWQVAPSPALYGLSLFLLSLAVLWQSALSVRLSNGDAALFATMAREMAAAPLRTWIHMGGFWEGWFYDKPPLLLWVEAATMRLIGARAEAAVVPTLIAAHLTVWLVYKMGKRLVDQEFGFLAALVLCLTPSFVVQSRSPITEPMLVFFMALSLYWGMKLGRSPLFPLGAGVALACAFLTKGPPALAVLPVLAVYYMTASPPAHCGENSRPAGGWQEVLSRIPWGRLSLVLVVALGILALVDLWHFSQVSFSFWKRLFDKQVLPAILGKRENTRTEYTYYLWVLGRWYWPWLPALVAGLFVPWLLRRGHLQRDRIVRAWIFALTQAGIILLGFSLVPKKTRFYTHPYYIGLTLLVALTLYVLLLKRQNIYRHLISGAVVLSVGIFILASVVPSVFHYPRFKLDAVIRIGREIKKTGVRIDTVQLIYRKCRGLAPWNLRFPYAFYLGAKNLVCGGEPKGIQLVDMRQDPSFRRDGSRILAIAYPFVLVDRRPGQKTPGGFKANQL